MVALGIDPGRRRIGLAISDGLGMMAFPLRVIRVVSNDQVRREIAQVVEERGAELVVVGLPINMDDSLGPKAQEALRFAEALRGVLPCPVETWDERLTTREAERAMIDVDMSRAGRKKRIDAAAAQIMLQSYLDAQT